MPSQSVPVFTFWSGINFAIVLILYLPIVLIVYWHAQSNDENGCVWALICVVLPIVGVIIYIAWVLMKHYRSLKPKTSSFTGMDSPDMELSRQRLRGGGKFIGKTHDDIEIHIALDEWDDAEAMINTILKQAELDRDGPTIADMIAYRERVKKGRKA
jgi:hypothetical protein